MRKIIHNAPASPLLHGRGWWWVFILLLFGIRARAGNVVTIGTASGAPDEEVTVSVSLTNTDEVSSLQVAIPLDEQLSFVSGSAVLSSRCGSHSVSAGVKDGTLNIMVFSMSFTAFSGSEGEVVSFRLKLGNQPMDIALAASKVILTDTDGNSIEGTTTTGGSVNIRCAKAQYSTMTVDFGSVPIRCTYSQTVTVTNIGNEPLEVTGLQFSKYPTDFSSTTTFPFTVNAGSCASINITYAPQQRGTVNETVKVVCNSISKLNTIALKAQPFAVNELHIQPASGIADETVTVSMTMNNMDAISGFQFEFTLPSQLEYVPNSFTLSSRKQDHAIVASLTNGVLRIICYSPNDTPFTGEDGEIATMQLKLTGRNSTTLKASKCILTATIDNQVTNVCSADYGATITISSPRINASNSLAMGATPITEDAVSNFVVRNYGNAPLTISRVLFADEDFYIQEALPLTVNANSSTNLTVVYPSTEEGDFATTMQIYSNDPEQRLWNVNVTGNRFAPNYLSLQTSDVLSNEIIKVKFLLDTYDDISGLQFDIEYPTDYYEPMDEVLTTERSQGMTVTHREMSNNVIRYFCYSMSNVAIQAGVGELFSLQFQPRGQMEVSVGNYSVHVSNIILGTSAMANKYSGVELNSSFHVYSLKDPITIMAMNCERVYGDANPVFSFECEGGELFGEPEIICEATNNSPVGTYPIIVRKGSITNYNLTFIDGTLTITKAPLTIEAGTYTKRQGEENPDFILTFTGFKNNETKDVLTKQPIASCAANNTSSPGEYSVTVSGAEAENYDISYEQGKLVVLLGTYTIHYDYIFEDNLLYTESFEVNSGSQPPQPTIQASSFMEMIPTTEVPNIIYGDLDITYQIIWKGPFQFTHTLDDAHWYNMTIRTLYHVGMDESEPYYPRTVDSETLKLPEFQWAFGGNPFQIKVYNRSTGLDKVLTCNGEQGVSAVDAVMRPGDYYWEILPNSDGFLLRQPGTDYTCINQRGGYNGPLQFWNSRYSLTDDGSTFRISEVVEESIPGDVNNDGQVTIADVTALVNIILGKDNTEPYLYNHQAADVNTDGTVTIADVTALVNIILGKNTSP